MDGGGFRNTLSALRTRGYIVDRERGQIGVGPVVTLVNDPFTSQEIQAIWQRKLSPAEWRMLEVLVRAGEDGLARAELATNANYDVEGGGFRNTLSALSTNSLVDKRDGRIFAAAELFS
jgi:hypothetical protein